MIVGRRLALAGLSVAWTAFVLTGCGSSDHGDMPLLTKAEWKSDPGSAADIGYWISVDFGWPSRASACFPLSAALHVTVDDREAQRIPDAIGDCVWDLLFEVGPFSPDAPVPTTVRVMDGSQVLGQATYDGLYPGYSAQLVTPSNGQVRTGDPIAIELAAPLTPEITFAQAASLYWLDPPDSVPPFYSYIAASFAPDRQSITAQAPAQTGRAALVIETFNRPLEAARSCVGFTSCTAEPSETIGPLTIDIVP
jgi:hypothetical protein